MPGYSGLYRVGSLTHLKICVFFSAFNCLPRGSSLKVHRLRYFTAKGKSMSELHIFISAVYCSCQHSKPCRVCARLISQLKFISTLFIYYTCPSSSKHLGQNVSKKKFESNLYKAQNNITH